MTMTAGSRSMSSHKGEQPAQRCMQAIQERCLKNQLEEKYQENVQLMYGWKLVDYHDHGEVIYGKIVASNDESKVQYVRSQYIVGCDGPASVVSRKVTAKFDGFVNLGQTRTIHFRSHGLIEKVRPMLGDALQYHIARPGYGVGWFVINSMEENLWTFFLVGLADGRTPRQLTRMDVENVLAEFIGPGVTFEIVSDAPWYIIVYVCIIASFSIYLTSFYLQGSGTYFSRENLSTIES